MVLPFAERHLLGSWDRSMDSDIDARVLDGYKRFVHIKYETRVVSVIYIEIIN